MLKQNAEARKFAVMSATENTPGTSLRAGLPELSKPHAANNDIHLRLSGWQPRTALSRSVVDYVAGRPTHTLLPSAASFELVIPMISWPSGVGAELGSTVGERRYERHGISSETGHEGTGAQDRSFFHFWQQQLRPLLPSWLGLPQDRWLLHSAKSPFHCHPET